MGLALCLELLSSAISYTVRAHAKTGLTRLRRGPRPRDAMQYGPQAGQGPRPHQPVARYRSREGMNHRATPEQAAVDMVDKMGMLPPGLAGSLVTLR